ncbi:acyltransferase family protein [Granulicella sibirica]|uniref:O-antigen acetylase n=1 Tax=Granulicella sibirica TaxID=2479048 RepID=A0A4Q0SYH7_9BACT|nr:acyltransferase [Granulicella sibirica]RXH54076.1 O-antigen acetylase [Granulicella sibirica]
MHPLQSARFHGLDTLRSVAIVAVMLFHLQDVLPEKMVLVEQYGWMGVDLFFVLSGFLIGNQLLKSYANGEKFSISLFYQRRMFRIVPAYVAVLLLYLWVPAWREEPGLAPAWEFFTFTENIFFQPQYRAFSHAWSLCVEEHFYLILPLLVMAMMRRRSFRRTSYLLAFVVAFGLAARAVAITHITDRYFVRIYYQTYMRLDGLSVGVTLALVKNFRPQWWKSLSRHGHASLLSGMVLVLAVMWMFRNNGLGKLTGSPAWGTVVGYPLLACGLGLIVASSLSTEGLLNRYRIPGTQLLATLAFSLYLTHKEIVHMDQIYFPTLTVGRSFEASVVFLTTCFAAAGVLHLLIERPFMQLRDMVESRSSRSAEERMRAEPAL